MPTHKTDLAETSLSQLVELTGSTPKTIAKRLREAGVRTVREDGRTLYYQPQVALRAIYVGSNALNPAEQKARLDKARADFQELRLREREGELLEAADVKSEWSRRVLNWKERIRSVPAAATVYIGGFTKEQGRALLKLIDETLVELADGKGEPKRKRKRAR